MKKQILLVLLLCISISARAQLKEATAIDSVFADWNNPKVPGCSLGIFKEGNLIYSKGYGLANMEYDIPNSPTTVFRIASTSKQFTAACVILLAEQGKLKLDDQLSQYFPEFPAYADKITVRHLLNHTSGIRDYLQLAYLKGLDEKDYYTDAEVMDWLIKQSDLNFPPGEEYLYSNSGYWLLGQIVNKVSGMNMAEFARKEIFEPLGMDNTHFHNDHTLIVKNRATGYAPIDEDEYTISMTNLDMIGDGGIFTTIEDIKKWDDAFYNSGVFSESFWEEMTKQGVLNNGKVIDYASGLIIGEYKGLKTIRHGGSFVGYRTELLRFPEEHLSIAIFANRADANSEELADQVADIILSNKLVEKVKQNNSEPESIQPAPEYKMDQLIGNYEIQPGFTVRLSVQNDSLRVFQNWDESFYSIFRVKGNSFQIPGRNDVYFTFTDLQDEKANNLIILKGGKETKAIRKKMIDRSKIVLEDYLGKFYSEELEATYIIEIENGELKVNIKGNSLAKDCLVHEFDQFYSPYGLIKFQREDGSISGFMLDSGRVKNLKFNKT